MGWFQLRFDFRRPLNKRSTACQRSLRSQWSNPLAAVTLTYVGRTEAGRNIHIGHNGERS